MKNLTKRDLHQFIAIFCVFLFCGASSYDAQNITNFMAAFPDVPSETIRLAYSIPQFVSGIMMMVTGAIVGKYISYRFACIGGSLLIGIPQLLTFVLNPSSWTMVLVLRTVMGFGLGLYGGRTALLALTTPKEEYAKLFGYCNAAMKGSAIVMPIIIGYLAKISWRHPFLINIVPLLTAVVMFFWMREPEKADPVEKKETVNSSEEKLIIPMQVWASIVILLLFTAAKYTSWAEYLTNNNLSDDPSVVAGFAQSLQNYAGLMVVLFFGQIKKILGKLTLPTAYISLMLVLGIMLLFKSSTMAIVGAVLWGVFYTIHFTTLQMVCAEVSNTRSKALCTSLILGMPLFANMLTNGFAEMFHKILNLGNITDSAFVGSIVLYGLCLVVVLVTGMHKATDSKVAA